MIARLSFRAAFLLLSAVLFVLLPLYSVRAAVTPRVLAFYYDWFDANTWNRNLLSDLPAQPYTSSDPAAIARHIQQAQSVGIDAFVVSWTGQDNPTDANFRTVLAAAQSAGFAATIDFETEHFASADQIVRALSYARDTIMTHPAFLHEGNKPVLFFWREQMLPVSDWANIRAAVDPEHQQVWIGEGVDISYQQVFDGHHLYSIAWSPDVNATLSDWAGRVRRAGPDKFWVATVMPGYDDTRTQRPARFARGRAGGGFYGATWQAAINSRPDWIIITSFNEWVEGTQIEPSVSYGNLYLDLTRQFAAQFKSGASLAPAVSQPAPTVTPTTSPKAPPLGTDQRLTTDILRVRAGPGTDYEILGRLRQGAVIDILARSEDGDWLQIAYPDVVSPGWVAAEFVAPRDGLDSFITAAPPPHGSITAAASEDNADSSPEESVYPVWY